MGSCYIAQGAQLGALWWPRNVGCGLGGREVHIYMHLIHAVVQQKLIQHCKAIVFQLKIKSKFKKERSQGSLWGGQWDHGSLVRSRKRQRPHQASVGSGAAFILNVDVLLIMEFFFNFVYNELLTYYLSWLLTYFALPKFNYRWVSHLPHSSIIPGKGPGTYK